VLTTWCGDADLTPDNSNENDIDDVVTRTPGFGQCKYIVITESLAKEQFLTEVATASFLAQFVAQFNIN